MSCATIFCLSATLTCAVPSEPANETDCAAWFTPDEIGYAGTLHMSVRNSNDAALEIAALRLNGRPVGSVWRSDESFTEPDVRDRYLEVNNEAVAWYRVFPNPVPPRGMTEIMIRLQPRACEETHAGVELDLADGATTSTRVALSPPAWRLDHIAVTPDLRTLFVYCRRAEPGVPEPLSVEIDEHRVPVRFERLFSGLRMARVDLPHRWKPGSYHSVAALTSDDMREVLVRALPNHPPLAIMGNLADSHARTYAQHLFDVHIAFAHGAKSLQWYPVLAVVLVNRDHRSSEAQRSRRDARCSSGRSEARAGLWRGISGPVTDRGIHLHWDVLTCSSVGTLDI